MIMKKKLVWGLNVCVHKTEQKILNLFSLLIINILISEFLLSSSSPLRTLIIRTILLTFGLFAKGVVSLTSRDYNDHLLTTGCK